jgi:hypothetical protein
MTNFSLTQIIQQHENELIVNFLSVTDRVVLFLSASMIVEKGIWWNNIE